MNSKVANAPHNSNQHGIKRKKIIQQTTDASEKERERAGKSEPEIKGNPFCPPPDGWDLSKISATKHVPLVDMAGGSTNEEEKKKYKLQDQ